MATHIGTNLAARAASVQRETCQRATAGQKTHSGFRQKVNCYGYCGSIGVAPVAGQKASDAQRGQTPPVCDHPCEQLVCCPARMSHRNHHHNEPLPARAWQSAEQSFFGPPGTGSQCRRWSAYPLPPPDQNRPCAPDSLPRGRFLAAPEAKPGERCSRRRNRGSANRR
ncbi:MAG: hypothetical protein QG592_718 [Pseudomonadota bacterium]|nr:hypothetical protein [Pseudomonadota bacterium]